MNIEPYYIVIDTETGGLNPLRNSLLQVGMEVVSRNLELIDAVKINIKSSPDLYTTKEALSINGIIPEEHDAHPDTLSPHYASAKLVDLLYYWRGKSRNKLIPCGWNPSFDVGFIVQQLAGPMWGAVCTYFNYDIASVAQFKKSHGHIPDDLRGLHATAKWCGISVDLEAKHSAIVDAEITRQLAIYFEA